MREIKFRGKTINEPIEWVYGGVMVSKDMGEAMMFEEILHPMEGEEDTGGVELSFHAVCVDINTVGQFTGLKDKNGVDIYEGDIFKRIDTKDTFIVIWNGDGFICSQMWDELKGRDVLNEKHNVGVPFMTTFKIEIVGNIHDK